MRVVHIAHSVAGGIAAYFEEIADDQCAAFGRENVFFIGPEGSEEHLPDIDPAQLITFPGSGRTPLGLLRFALATARAIRRLQPQVVHLHSTFAGAIVRPLVAMLRQDCRIVYCPHGWAFGMETSNLKRFAYAECERLLAKRTDLIIVNSESERFLGVSFGIRSGKMRTVRNGIVAAESPHRIEPSTPDRLIDIAFIGRHDRQKGLDILLDSLRRSPCEKLRLHVVGKEIVGRKFIETGDQDNIRFHGWLPRREVFELIRRMDAVIMPSRWEAFGLVAVEAMRCGVPVLASNRGALPEIIRDGIEGYIFDIDEPGSLARVLSRLERGELRRLGRAARARFLSEFTADRMNRLIFNAYEGVMNAAPAHAQAAAPVAAERALGRTIVMDGTNAA